MALERPHVRIRVYTMADWHAADADRRRAIEQHWKRVWDGYQRQRLCPGDTVSARKQVQR